MNKAEAKREAWSFIATLIQASAGNLDNYALDGNEHDSALIHNAMFEIADEIRARLANAEDRKQAKAQLYPKPPKDLG